MNTNDISIKKSDSAVIFKMNLEKLKDLLRIKAKDRKEDQVQQIYTIIQDFSILPQYFYTQNAIAGQIQVEIENINKIISSKMEFIELNNSSNLKQNIKNQKAIYLLLEGSIKIEKQLDNAVQNTVQLKEYKEGDYFSFYDLEYEVDSAQITILKHQKLQQIQKQSKSNNTETIEVGCIFLQDFKGARQNQEIEQKILTKSQFILSFYDNIIKKEISLFKLNNGFIQNLNDKQIGSILFHSKILSYSQKDMVYLNNDDSEYLYVVRKGCFCVLWRDQLSSQQRKSIILSQLASESQQTRRWPLRIYESKDIFGEEDIINNCRKRCFDIICESSVGQLIVIPKNYFLNVLYPLLQTYFDKQVESKEKLINERILQIKSKYSKPFSIISNSLQSTQPISRECKENSLNSSSDTIDKKHIQQFNSSSQKDVNLKLEIEFLKQDQSQQIQYNSTKIFDDNKELNCNSLKGTQTQNNSEGFQKCENKDNTQSNIKQNRIEQIQEKITQPQNWDKKITKKSITVRKQENKKQIQKVQNIQNLVNSISCPNKDDSGVQQDSINQIIKLHQSLIKQSRQSSTKNFQNHNQQEDILSNNQKNFQILKQHSEIVPSLHQIPFKLKSSNSFQNVYSQSSWYLKDQFNNSSQSPQKNYCHLQNISEHYQQSTERRKNKKLNIYNELKRQTNRMSPSLDKALVQQSSSENASQGTNSSGGCFNFLSVLASSHQMNKSIPRINQSTTNRKSNSNISFNSSKTSTNNQNQSNLNTFGEIFLNQQISPLNNQEFQNEIRKESEENNSEQNNLLSKNSTQSPQQQQLQQKQNQQQQQAQTPSHSQKLQFFSNMVYSKIKEKEDMRKGLKKEYALLKKKGNLNALSDYSFKLGNYKIKSELLSNSYENLKQIQISHNQSDNSLIKLKRRFSGDDNILSNKPKYLFTTHQYAYNKFQKNNQKYLLNKIVGCIINEPDYKNQFLNNPLQKDVKVLLSQQSPPILAIEKLISDQTQKPSITQRVAKINNNQQNQKNQQNQINTIPEPFQLDIPNLNQNQINLLQNRKENKQSTKLINTEEIQRQDPINIAVNRLQEQKIQNEQLGNQQQQQQQKQQIQQRKYNNFINLNNVYLNKAISVQASLQLQTKLQYYKQNLNSSGRNNQGILKQILDTPANKNLSQQQISQYNQQQTFSQLTNNSNININNSNPSLSQAPQQQDLNEKQNEFLIQ